MESLFLLPGQGSQYPAMGQELYRTEPTFAEGVDEAFESLEREFPGSRKAWEDPGADFTSAFKSQPALLAVQVGIARLLRGEGIEPTYVLGHSAGELAGAVLTKMISLPEAATLLRARFRHVTNASDGKMLAAAVSAEAAATLTEGIDVELAAINGPRQVMFAGPDPAIPHLLSRLDEQEIAYVFLGTDKPFHHSSLVDRHGILRRAAEAVSWSCPNATFVSGYKGRVVTHAECTEPDYWVDHPSDPVYYWPALQDVSQSASPPRLIIEVGPGTTLSSIARRTGTRTTMVAASMPTKAREGSERKAVAKLRAALETATRRGSADVDR